VILNGNNDKIYARHLFVFNGALDGTSRGSSAVTGGVGIGSIAPSSWSTLSRVSRVLADTDTNTIDEPELLETSESEGVMSRTLLPSSVSSINSTLLQVLRLWPMFK
jgi:hypothetical protein